MQVWQMVRFNATFKNISVISWRFNNATWPWMTYTQYNVWLLRNQQNTICAAWKEDTCCLLISRAREKLDIHFFTWLFVIFIFHFVGDRGVCKWITIVMNHLYFVVYSWRTHSKDFRLLMESKWTLGNLFDEKYLGRTDRGKTVYPPPPSGSGGIINVVLTYSGRYHVCEMK
jgi:hypothetical protein